MDGAAGAGRAAVALGRRPRGRTPVRRRPWSPGVADAVREQRDQLPSARRRQAAEASRGPKAFAKDVMAAAGVPTGCRALCTDGTAEVATALGRLRRAVRRQGRRARRRQGRGRDRRTGTQQRAHAARCDRVVIEEFLDGPEVSLVRDHRRLDRLPAAAGPGLQADLRRRPGAEHRRHGCLHAAAVGAEEPGRRRCRRQVLQPTVDEMAPTRRCRSPACCTPAWRSPRDGVRVVEFNARFGDPETQPLMALLDSPLAPLLKAAADRQRCDEVDPPRWKARRRRGRR